MMSMSSGKYGARLSDTTAVDPADPFDVTDRSAPVPARETQLSDPPTVVVRREGFHELPAGTIVGDNYEIETRLGAGAMGEVYAARHMKLGKRVAVKIIGKRLSEDAAAIERFAMEARALAQIQHPAIVAVEHVGELTDGRAFFIMEFLRGQSLFERLQHGRLSLSEALRVIDQIARGLDAAHTEGIIHRDLKPENTFLVHLPGEEPLVKIVDFGLSKLAADRADEDQRAERTQSGVAIGTPMYMSPEQMRGQGVDYRTDVYALGCVAYELLLGEPPFPQARTAPELFAAHLAESPPLPRAIWPDIQPQLDLVLFAMLAKDPAHRPTLAQVRSVIADVRTGSNSQRAATEFVNPRATRVQRWVTISVITVLALIGGIAIGAATMHRRNREAVDTPTVRTPPASHGAAPMITLPITPAAPVHAVVPPSVPVQAPEPHVISRAPSKVLRQPVVVPTVTQADAGIPEIPITSERLPYKPSPKAKSPIDRNLTLDPFSKKIKATP